jgi:uncharacterized membrane protein YkvA (DUF1232 family)
MTQRSDLLNVLLVLGGLALVAILVVAVFYFLRLARLWALVRDPAMPAAGKFAFWAGLVYAVFPVDVLPDPIYLDDIGVLAAAAAYVLSSAKKAGLLNRRGAPPVGRASRDGEWVEPPHLDDRRR